MSKRNENGEELQRAETSSATPGFRAIEEHAKEQNISAPVFAAVKQMKGWADGKSVDEREFKRAVTDFLGAPMRGGN